MSQQLSPSARRIQEVLASLGADFEVVELPSTTRTALEAATAIGCSVEQIAKSILFRTVKDKKPIMVIASGVNRVNEAKIAGYVGEAIEKADAAYVREKTGYVIGGVAPIGHTEPIYTMIDEELMKQEEVWAAAGTPRTVFKVRSRRLVEITGGELRGIK